MMGRRTLGIAWVLLTAGAGLAAENWNVDAFVGWQGLYRPMQWTPVRLGVKLTGAKEPFDADIALIADQDAYNRMHVSTIRTVEPNEVLSVPMAVKLAYPASNLTVVFRDRKTGRVRFDKGFPLSWSQQGTATLRAVPQHHLFLGGCGTPRAGLRLLESRCRVRRAGGPDGRVQLARSLPEHLPWDWVGYAGLDAMAAHDVDWLRGVNDYQQAALVEWVRRGGSLVLTLAGNPLPKGGPLAEALPLATGAARRLGAPPADLAALGLSGASGPANVALREIQPSAGIADWRVRTLAGQPAVLAGPLGFGRICVILFDPVELTRPGQDANGQRVEPALAGGSSALTPFWAARLEDLELTGKTMVLSDRKPPPGNPGGPLQQDYAIGPRAAGDNSVCGHLRKIPQLRPLSIWWIVGLLSALALVVGPVDYFVLKKLDIQPWTWVTTGAVVVLFTVGAWIGVERIRGGSQQVRVVTVCDRIGTDGPTYTCRYVGIFAPESTTYAIDGLAAGQWWSGVSPTDGTAVPYFNQRDASWNLFFRQGDGGNLPRPVPISIWSMQTLLDEQRGGDPDFSAQLTVTGDKEIRLEIVNRSDAPITQGYVLHRGRRLRFGRIDPTSSRTIRGKSVADPNGWREEMQQLGPAGENASWVSPDGPSWVGAYHATGSLDRTRAIERRLAEGAAVVCVGFAEAPLPLAVQGGRGTVNHVKLSRLVVEPTRSER